MTGGTWRLTRRPALGASRQEGGEAGARQIGEGDGPAEEEGHQQCDVREEFLRDSMRWCWCLLALADVGTEAWGLEKAPARYLEKD